MNRDTAILQLMNTSGIGAKRLSRLLKRLQNESYPVEDFVMTSTKELIERYGFTESMVASLKEVDSELNQLSDKFWELEIKVITQQDNLYPSVLSKVLGEDAPPVLFIKGNLKILENRAVGFCGSRKASEKGCELVRDSASYLARQGVNIVSGYAHGVDLAAHIGALSAGGVTTLVLPLGIMNYSLKTSLLELMSDDNMLIMSEFSPRLGWAVHNAMQRNLTICGLSRAMVLVDSALKGGTFEAGKAALKLERPLFVWEYQSQPCSEGNEYFLKRGAIALTENGDLGPSLDKISDVINKENLRSKQQSLFE